MNCCSLEDEVQEWGIVQVLDLVFCPEFARRIGSSILDCLLRHMCSQSTGKEPGPGLETRTKHGGKPQIGPWELWERLLFRAPTRPLSNVPAAAGNELEWTFNERRKQRS